MNFKFTQKRISGILTILPKNERSFVEEMANFNSPIARSMKLKEVMGYDKHRIVEGNVCVSDLAIFGLEFLFENRWLEKDGFEALILVTQSPDYIMPATSNVIQGRLGLKQNLLCLDINQGCAGFMLGLIQAFLLLEQPAIQKVILINADVMSRKVSPKDRNSYPLIGDAASITIVERSSQNDTIHLNLKMDGSRYEALMIPAGGFRLPASSQTALLEEDSEGNSRAQDHLRMDGSAVFNFVQTEVPPMIEDLLDLSSMSIEDIDAFVFHQPNRFMLHKLADKMKIPHAKMPSNIVENFGNSSGVTIPLATTFNLGKRLITETLTICFAGFGVGLTWSSAIMKLGPLDFCGTTEFP